MTTREEAMPGEGKKVWGRDEFGMTDDDWREIAFAEDQQRRHDRWRAFKALWLKPVVDEQATRWRRDGVICYRDARDEEWSLAKAVLATIGIVFGRRWSDAADQRWRRRTGEPYIHGTSLCYWDAVDTYGGYDVMVCQLYPGCRVSIFSDGECLM